ncbi:hypothetical protein AWB78_08556 [Caballeronia calidae]|uniref:Uncharacterized protein n=1 Tax=Caballeronia calidae TaxID=1777139 RepID=A0A158EKP9_9BURK|nr:hypothetical protein AWB78_08556 [Caballeronia calidae]
MSEKLKAHPISKVVASLHAYPTPTTNVPDLVAREAAKRELTRRFNTADISRDGAAKKLFEQRLEFAQWVGDKSALHERSFLKGNGGQTLGVFGYASNDAGRAVIALLEESILGNPIDRSILFPSQVIVDALKIADTPDNPSRIKNVIQTWLDVRGLSGLYTTPKKEPGKELKKEPGKEPENMPGKEPEKKEVDAALSAVQTPEAFRRALKIGVPEKQEEFWAWRYATKFKEALQNGLQQQDSGLAAKVVDYFLWTGDMPKVEQLPSVPQSVREQLNSRWPFFEAALSYSGPTAAQAKNRAAVQEELKQVLMGKTEFISDKWSARFLSQLKPVGTDESLVERRRTILQSLGSVSGDESERDAIKQIFSLHSLKYDELTDENRLSWACAHFRKLGLQDQFIKERESISKKLMGKYIEEDFYDKLSTIADRLAEQKMRGQLETLLTKACNGDLDALFGLYVEEYLADPGSDAQNIAMIYWSRRESGQAQNDDEILKKWLIRYDEESSEFYTIFDLNDDGAGRMNSVAEAVADALNQRGTEQFIEKMEKADAIDNLDATQKFSILERLHNEGLKKQGHKFCDRIADIITKIYRSLSIDEQAECREQILKHWNIEYDADSDEFSEIFDLGETSNSGDAAMNRMAAAIAEAMNGNEESVLKERSLPDLWTYLAESE